MKRDLIPPAESYQEIPCPIHGQPLELVVQDNKIIGKCQCKPDDRKYTGQPVYEQTIEKE